MVVVTWKTAFSTASLFLTFTPPSSGFAPSLTDSARRAFRPSTGGTRLFAGSSSIDRDVVIIGGGLAGLSIAFELTQGRHPPRHITILDKSTTKKSSDIGASSFAAAGMLAPQSERLPSGPYLDICLASRAMYADFVSRVEECARNSGSFGDEYLLEEDGEGEGEEKWQVGFVASGGFLAPAFAGDGVATWAPPKGSGVARWMDEIQVRELEPELHPDVVGGWWFPEDASVDARRLTRSLRAACAASGVHILMGSDFDVTSLELSDGSCQRIKLSSGQMYTAKQIILANGAWMRKLLPVPIIPHKGQSLSLRIPSHQPPLLHRVLFAQDTYIVPKEGGHRIIVGATVEPDNFDPCVTVSGMMHCMQNAIALLPALGDLEVEETWSGMRPTTPDKLPILGKTPWSNLFLAGGYWRNGVLLSPKTAQLVADLVNDSLEIKDQQMLEAFVWERFISEEEGGTKIAVDSRFAASMHPVQKRGKGSAAVGVELGFYSNANEAGEERKKDRDMLFGNGNDDDFESAFERAAMMGKKDGSVFVWDDQKTDTITDTDTHKSKENESTQHFDPPTKEPEQPTATSSDYDATTLDGYGAIQDANGSSSRAEELNNMRAARQKNRIGTTAIDESKIGVRKHEEEDEEEEVENEIEFVPEQNASNVNLPDESDADDNLSDIYKTIQQNKANAGSVSMGEALPDDRPDFPFRIYHVNHDTREKTLIPPYTSPQAFAEMQEKKALAAMASSAPNDHAETPLSADVTNREESTDEYDETTFDGYVVIQEANGAPTREQELVAMRAARQKNRIGMSNIDESKIGGVQMSDDHFKNGQL